MATGIAMGPMLVLALAVGGLVLLVRLASGRGRRRGGIVVACIVMLMALAMFGVFLPRTVYSRAKVEEARAVAEREQARLEQRMWQQSMAANVPHAMNPDLPDEPDEDVDEDGSAESIKETADAAVEEIKNTANWEVDAIKSTVEASVRGVEVQVNRPIPPIPPRKIDKKSSRSSQPYRTSRDQIISSILLLGVVLAGYFFLNANTRGHYTWRLRIGSTLVFAASLAVILLICR